MAAAPGDQFQSLVNADAEEDIDIVDDGEEVFAGDDETEFEIIDSGDGQSAEDNRFDEIIGGIEEIILADEFCNMQKAWCAENCHHFTDDEENKLIYTELLEKYSNFLEDLLEKHLSRTVPGFDMGEFARLLGDRKDDLEGPVFDMLMAMTDYEAFRDMMIAINLDKQGKGSGLSLSGEEAHIYTEEQEDGEERPDLNLSIASLTVG
mmetsp:Transcript_33873/g.40965  ORF Transcript_33873/g.40965 Transcript_33873/m.40965 type:complete len:207 (-) Transcript_33873:368-988(-)|eukprot:CAMPEP_0197862454 /NCGR_PEP_ID=MMETSP1438-20131217/39232_1 /TAXON_ID=1461541 /ORGANISM="Pterosperma sp., Strain CCMP1384" /LENGTH=206 /DNA_ID=CAMNT_0043480015 /DNA_START=220 /DNA_END=840 /DNA_ORIENTATION=-